MGYGYTSRAGAMVGHDHVRRYEVNRVRSILSMGDRHLTAKFKIVDRALDEAECDVSKAAELVKNHPEVASQFAKLKIREELFKKLPMGRPPSGLVEKAMREAGGDISKAADLLTKDPTVQEGAKNQMLF